MDIPFPSRVALQERVYGSALLQRAYGAATGARGRLTAALGRDFAAARTLLHAKKHLGPRFSPRRARFLEALVARATRREDGSVRPSSENALRRDFVASREARAVRRRFASYGPRNQVRLRWAREGPDDPERQGDLIVLKRAADGEKGVLLVAYHDAILHLPAVFDLPALASRYSIVLEPSTWGYDDARFLLYVGSDLDVVVEAQSRPDFDLVAGWDTNLVPTRVGSGDWADPDAFRAKRGDDRTYDLAMVSAWDPVKRHEVLFRALAAIRTERARRLRVALVGYPMRWTRARIERQMRRHGLEADCDVFERVPHAEVARILADARASILLSRREGANRAVYESLFCDTPVIVPAAHRGVNLDHVGPDTGRLATDEELPDAILDVVDGRSRFRPRAWALAHTGWRAATASLEGTLREAARRRGAPWTTGLVGKTNAPGLRYAEPGAWREFEPEYESLAAYLLPA
jgi:glycosyltransferase involved in cell wall biosynthesis